MKQGLWSRSGTDTAPDGAVSKPRRGRATASSGDPRIVGGTIGALILVAIWAFASGSQPDFILPSPVKTWQAFLELFSDGKIVTELSRTLFRAAVGVLAAVLVGVVWGALGGVSRWVTAISRPAVSALMAVPPVIVVALGLIWFGPGDTVIRLVVFLVALPLIVVTVQEAVRDIDYDLIEMAEAFGISRPSRIAHVIAPAVASPTLAAVSVTFGQAIRVSVMAELLSATNGVGAQVSLARTNLTTDDLFAWTITLVTVVILLETFVLNPMTNWLLRWRTAPATTSS